MYIASPYEEEENDENVLNEEDRMGEEEFEKSLTTLGSQKVQSSPESLSQLDSVVNTWASNQSKTGIEIFPFAQESISSEDQVQSLSPSIKEGNVSTPTERPTLSLLSSESPAIRLKKGDIVELKAQPPTLNFFHRSSPIRLHPKNNNENVNKEILIQCERIK